MLTPLSEERLAWINLILQSTPRFQRRQDTQGGFVVREGFLEEGMPSGVLKVELYFCEEGLGGEARQGWNPRPEAQRQSVWRGPRTLSRAC